MRMLMLLLLSVATLAGIVWKLSNDARLNRPLRETPQVRTFELETPPAETRAPKPVAPVRPTRTVEARVPEPALEAEESPAVLPESPERMLALPLVRVEPEPPSEETLEEEVTVAAAGEFDLESARPSEPIDQDAWESLIRRMLALYRSDR